MHQSLESGFILAPLIPLVRHHLPGETVFIREPAALHLLPAAGCELFPVIIDLLLRLTVDHKRDRFGKLEAARHSRPRTPAHPARTIPSSPACHAVASAKAGSPSAPKVPPLCNESPL